VLEIRDNKGIENIVADHLSRLPTALRKEGECDLSIDDSFPGDHLFALAVSSAPWFANLVNYLACGIMPPDMNSHQRNRFFSQAKSYFWEEPCLYKGCGDGLFGDVYSKRRLHPLFPVAMICLVVDMQVVIKLLPRYFKLPSIGPLYSKMFMLMFGFMTVVEGLEVDQGGMKYLSTIFSRLKFLMFGVWNSWALFYPLGGKDIYWLRWIMCPNGWKPLLAPPMMPEWLLDSLRRLSFLVLEFPES